MQQVCRCGQRKDDRICERKLLRRKQYQVPHPHQVQSHPVYLEHNQPGPCTSPRMLEQLPAVHYRNDSAAVHNSCAAFKNSQLAELKNHIACSTSTNMTRRTAMHESDARSAKLYVIYADTAFVCSLKCSPDSRNACFTYNFISG